ncbi:MAG: zinc-ribbon domain-containing protein, partial [Peptostreptococcaceae bacterium]|nr:zinc-ribbon domain-containing protein [Peptostreptococcaceae bacterium]
MCNKKNKCILFDRYPEAEKMWDYERNTVDPSDVKIDSKTKIFWKCDKGHSFKRDMHTFLYGTKKCSVCKKLKASVSGKPNLMKFWDFEKNAGLDVKQISAKSPDFAHWKCPMCGYEWEATIRVRARKDSCPLCSGSFTGIIKGINDSFTIVPRLALDYDQALNPGIDMGMHGIGSHQRIQWRCHICGDIWPAPIYRRIRKTDDVFEIGKCPVCAKQKRAQTFDLEYPQLIPLFNEKESGCKLSDLQGTDRAKNFIWTCEKHGNYSAVLSSVIRAIKIGNTGCPYCHGTKVKIEDSFGVLYPEIVKEWSPDNNCSPYSVTPNSKKEVEWICNKDHKWNAIIYTRTNGYGYCRECFPRGKKSKRFADVYPEMKRNYGENNKTKFEDLWCNDIDKATWVCEKGHVFQNSCFKINRAGKLVCHVCNYRTIVLGLNDFKTLYPEYAKDYSDKNEITSERASPINSDMETWWVCGKGHEFQRSIAAHIKWDGVCPICSRHVLSEGENDILTTYPKVVEVWDYKNNDKRPEKCFDSKYNNYNFICNIGHHYNASLSQIINNNYKCLVCDDIMLQEGVNSLVDSHFELTKEWSSNNERGPETVFKKSKISALWICPECGGEYTAKVNNREVGDDSCPYCVDKKILLGYNDLATTD